MELAKSTDDSVVRLLRSWAVSRDDDDGQEALRYIARQQLTDDVADEATKLVLESTPKPNADNDAIEDENIADQLMGQLLKYPRPRAFLASRLRREPLFTWRKLYDHGDDSIDGLVAVLLDTAVWPSEEERVAAQRDVFQLGLAKLMEAGAEDPDRAMRVISRLLAAEASHLNGIIDHDGFDVILSSLDIRLSNTLRSHATLATVKLLELSPESAQRLISQFVMYKLGRATSENIIIAFSAAAAVFPMAPPVASALFLTPGFLEDLVPLVASKQSQRVEQATLELLSAACMDKACREATAKHCKGWLQTIESSGTDTRRSNLAALVLTKIARAAPKDPQQKEATGDLASRDDFVERFKDMLVTSADDNAIQESIEGLAYSSIQPRIKEKLADDSTFLKNLVQTLSSSTTARPSLFGGLTILSNLTAHLPAQSEEHKRLSQLKAYANKSNPTQADPLDNDAHVTARCKKVLDAGVVPLLASCTKRASTTVLSLAFQILLSLSREREHRPTLTQQGAIKLIVQKYDAVAESSPVSNGSQAASPPSRVAAHALARILISTNPSHVFSSALPVTSAIRPLLSLLEEDPSAERRDLLPAFEALLALTNLASTADDAARAAVVRLAWPRIEDLLLSDNAAVQRAAVELVCNLVASQQGAARFADGSKQAGTRLHVLLALADAEDPATRRAAGGALAMLTGWGAVVDAVLEREKGADILLGMCGEESEELVHRGVVCVRNVVCAPGDAGGRGREKVGAAGGAAVLKEALRKSTRNREIMQVGVEALKALSG